MTLHNGSFITYYNLVFPIALNSIEGIHIENAKKRRCFKKTGLQKSIFF